MSLVSRLQLPSGQRLVARLSSTTSTGRSFWATVPTTISNAGCSSSTTTSAPSLSSSTSLRIPKLRIGTSHLHHHLYHTTPSLYSSGTPGKKQKDRQQADPTPEELSETSDTIPEWQNPRHMNSEEVVFFDTDNLSSSPPPSPLPLPPFETCPDAIVAPPHIEELAQQIVQLNLLELKELVDQIANAFEFDDDVMAASYMNGAALMGASGGAGSSEPVEEAPAKVIFDVKLIGFDAKAKIKVIKEIRAISGLGLKEAKELVEAAPKVFAKDLKQEKADEIKAQLEAVGAQVEIL